MGVKVKDFINKKYEGRDVSNPTAIEEMEFYNYMINKMKELGEYVGIDITNFSDDFFIRCNPLTVDSNRLRSLYCYNKIKNTFNLILYTVCPRDDILLDKAITCKINLEDRTFEYHEFKKPSFLRYGVNIIHRKMSGVLPNYFFNPNICDNIVNGVINKDFNESSLSQNFILELEGIVENSKNKKEYIYDDALMWDVYSNIESLYSRLEYNSKSLYSII